MKTKQATEDLKSYLDDRYLRYNNSDFIESDPIQIPHQFDKKEDIEISAFLTATIAWGQRKTIINNANKMIKLMAGSPYDFVKNHDPDDLEVFEGFVHRTFNDTDLRYFITSLRHIYKVHGGLESVFSQELAKIGELGAAISGFRKIFFENKEARRTSKHVSDPLRNSSAKRICMFLRWMVRRDDMGVDFGIWDSIKPSRLMCPLDVHTGRIGRALGLLKRKQNDWKAVQELTVNLASLDPEDPVKYDFALFGIGAFENV